MRRWKSKSRKMTSAIGSDQHRKWNAMHAWCECAAKNVQYVCAWRPHVIRKKAPMQSICSLVFNYTSDRVRRRLVKLHAFRDEQRIRFARTKTQNWWRFCGQVWIVCCMRFELTLGHFECAFFVFRFFISYFFCDKFQTKQLKWSAHEVKRLHYLDSFICWRNCCWSLQISVLAGRRMKSHQSWIHGTYTR